MPPTLGSGATVGDLVAAIYGHPQVRYLAVLIAANLVLGLFASLRSGDFRLTAVADWLVNRVIPLLSGYGAAALVATVTPDLSAARDLAFATLIAALSGYLFKNLRDAGVPVPDSLAGTRSPEPPPVAIRLVVPSQTPPGGIS